MKALIIEDAEEVAESIKLCISIRWPECTFLSTPSGETGPDAAERISGHGDP